MKFVIFESRLNLSSKKDHFAKLQTDKFQHQVSPCNQNVNFPDLAVFEICSQDLAVLENPIPSFFSFPGTFWHIFADIKQILLYSNFNRTEN